MWVYDDDFRELVHDKDLSLEGKLHQFALFIIELQKNNLNEELSAHKSFLRIFKDEFPNPKTAINSASPAAVFQALASLYRLDVVNQSAKNKALNDYYEQLLLALKDQNQQFLHETNTVDEAVKKYTESKNDAWILFEYLCFNISNRLEKSGDNQTFADFIMKIYKKLAPSDGKILRLMHTRDNKPQNVTHTDAQEKLNPKSHKKKNKKTNETVALENPKINPGILLVNEIDSLSLTALSITPQYWQHFFISLCQKMIKHMPHQDKDLESYDLLIHEQNEAYVKEMVVSGSAYVELTRTHDKALLLMVIGKFYDGCIRCKNTPVSVSMTKILDIFNNADEGRWKTRAHSKATKNRFFDSVFPPDYLQKLTPEQRDNLCDTFENTVCKLSGFPPQDRSDLIKYCADKLSTKKEIKLDKTKPLPNVSPVFPVPSVPSLQPADKVLPGTRNLSWDKFITTVYTPFTEENALWDENLSDDEALIKIQPLLDQFKNNYPNAADRAQAQRYFISFIGQDDCKFAKGAAKYAWIFLEEMLPASTIAPVSQRYAIRKLKEELAFSQSVTTQNSNNTQSNSMYQKLD